MANNHAQCPFCNGESTHTPTERYHNIILCACQGVCRTPFYFNSTELAMRGSKVHSELKDQVPLLLRERALWKEPRPLLVLFPEHFKEATSVNIHGTVPIDLESWLKSRWPASPSEHVDRALMNLCKSSSRMGDRVRICDFDRDRDWPLLLTRGGSEGEFILAALKDAGWIDYKQAGEHYAVEHQIWVLPKGWERFHTLMHGRSAVTNPAFVAMWFGGEAQQTEMTRLWEQFIHPAIGAAGYNGKRADSEPHNEYIMDRVRADIRRAPFVVAEFTQQTNGVYYEAGFAAGLGIPVIPCYPAAEKRAVHFDVAQINAVIWENGDDLRSKLEARITGSIGDGPFKPPSN